MKVRAPGKVVLSGAYCVLEGAPALVAAVDRYALVDGDLVGDFLTDEVKAAGLTAPYWFDASALRQDGRKLGLGSSAAILVATLAAQRLQQPNPPLQDLLADCIFPKALAAHRLAQGGGSGVDVAASCYGGFLRFQLGLGEASIERLAAPAALHLEVWISNHAASTVAMLNQVRGYKERDPAGHHHDLSAQADAAEATARAWSRQDDTAIVYGLMAQRHALQRLGENAQVPIVTPEVRKLADLAEPRGAAVLPAGAGGGDIALYAGTEPSSAVLGDLAHAGHTRLGVTLGVPGVHADFDTREGGSH